MLNLDHPSRSTGIRRRRAAAALNATNGEMLADHTRKPLARIGAMELALWAIAIFFLTSPFSFWAMSIDPLVSATRDISSMRSAEGSQWRLYAMRAGVFLFGIVMTMRYWSYLPKPLLRLWPLLPFMIWAGLSMAWIDAPTTNLNSLVSLVALVLAALFICFRLTYTGAARALVLSSIVLVFVTVIFALAMPGYGMHQAQDATQAVHAGAWRGSYFHKNQLGQVCAVMLVALVLANDAILPRRWLRIMLVIACCALIALSTSASGAVTVPIALALHWLFIELPRNRRLRALLYIVPLVIGGVFLTSQILILMGRDLTLTGRTEVWEVAWDWFSAQPLQGYGFNTLTYGGFSFELFRKRGLVDPHNGYFEIAMGTGLVGLILFLFPLVMALYFARRQYAAGGITRATSSVFSGVLIAWMIASATEVDFRPFTAPGGLGFFALAALLMIPPAQTRVPRPA